MKGFECCSEREGEDSSLDDREDVDSVCVRAVGCPTTATGWVIELCCVLTGKDTGASPRIGRVGARAVDGAVGACIGFEVEAVLAEGVFNLLLRFRFTAPDSQTEVKSYNFTISSFGAKMQDSKNSGFN